MIKKILLKYNFTIHKKILINMTRFVEKHIILNKKPAFVMINSKITKHFILQQLINKFKTTTRLKKIIQFDNHK